MGHCEPLASLKDKLLEAISNVTDEIAAAYFAGLAITIRRTFYQECKEMAIKNYLAASRIAFIAAIRSVFANIALPATRVSAPYETTIGVV